MARQPSPPHPTQSGSLGPESGSGNSAHRPEQTTGQAVLEALAEGLAEVYESSIDQARDCLDRLVNTFRPELVKDPAELSQALRRAPLNLLSQALATMSASRAVELFQTANLHDLARRVQLTTRLFAEATPLYTVAELADRLNEFIVFLHRHRDFIIETGLPPEPFRSSSWLDLTLGRLYDTRMTSSPWPPYRWVQTPGDQYNGSEVRICDYHRADVLNGLDPSFALRLEAEREKLFDLKVQVLERAVAALRRQQVTDLWPSCLALLKDNLTTEAVEVCLYIDRFRLGRDFTQDGEAEDNPRMITGGLTNWLELVGHVEEELTLGSLAQARSHLDDSAVDRLNELFDNITSDQFYFAVVGRPEQQGLDATIDALITDHADVQAFWQDFRKRVENAFETAFKILLPIRVASAHAGLAEPLLQRYADHVQTQLDQGKWFDQPPSGMSVFRRDGSTWTICFEGKLLGKPDSVGLFYLRLLLERPGKALHVSMLRQVRALWQADPTRPLRSYLDQVLNAAATGDNGIGRSSGDLGDAIDAQAVQSCQQRITELDQLILQAQDTSDVDQLKKLQHEHQELNTYVNQAQGLGGKRARMSRQGKKDRDAVCKAINEAVEDLSQSHPALGRHLDKHLTVEALCGYEPGSPVAWEF